MTDFATPSLCLVAMVRNASSLIEPWLDYHRALGVSGAIVYLDDCTDDTPDRLRAYDWVTVLDAPPRHDGHRVLADRQRQLLPAGTALADEAGHDWALLIDPDEYLWPHSARTPLDADVIAQGWLPALFDRVGPSVEQVHFPTNEAVPVPSRVAATFLDNHHVARRPVERDLRLPAGLGQVRLSRFLGHPFGKMALRSGLKVGSDLPPHRWTHRDGTALRTLSLGCLVHHYAGDIDTWQGKLAQQGWQADRWDEANPVPEHIHTWRQEASRMSTAEARRYFNDHVALSGDALESAIAAGSVVNLPVISAVLDAHRRQPPSPTPTTRNWRYLPHRLRQIRPISDDRGERVVFLAFDACDFERMLALADRGEAPNVDKLRKNAYAVPTSGPLGVYVGAIWPDFHTAAHPGHHGRHSWKQITPGTYDITPQGVPTELGHPTIYERLSNQGRNVAVVDPPLLTPLDCTATQVLEWGSHDPFGGPASVPGTLITELTGAFGEHPLPEQCNSHDHSLERHLVVRDSLIDGVAAKTAVLLDVYRRYQWDLFVGVYKESHCAGHQLWHVTDPTFPSHDPTIAEVVGTPIDDVYRRLDGQLGDWMEAIDDETTLVLWLSHGMGPHNDPTFYLDVILRRLESTRRFADEWRAAKAGVAAAPADSAACEHARQQLRDLNERVWEDVHRRPIGERDFFYAPNNETEGGIRLNIEGREPAGRVRPGDRKAMVQWLTDRLLELTDADSGDRLVAEVLDLHERYPGPAVDRLPDLAVVWNRPDHMVEGIASPFLNGVQRLPYHGARSGDHRPLGMAFIARPGRGLGRHETVITAGELGATVARLSGLAPGETVCEAITLST